MMHRYMVWLAGSSDSTFYVGYAMVFKLVIPHFRLSNASQLSYFDQHPQLMVICIVLFCSAPPADGDMYCLVLLSTLS